MTARAQEAEQSKGRDRLTVSFNPEEMARIEAAFEQVRAQVPNRRRFTINQWARAILLAAAEGQSAGGPGYYQYPGPVMTEVRESSPRIPHTLHAPTQGDKGGV